MNIYVKVEYGQTPLASPKCSPDSATWHAIAVCQPNEEKKFSAKVLSLTNQV